MWGRTLKFFNQNHFGWYILVVKDKKRAQLYDDILVEYLDELKTIVKRSKK